MIVVSDTTALTTLIKAGLDGILPQLFSTILIPQFQGTVIFRSKN